MDTFSEVLTKSPIVIDNGSGSIKAGFAGEDKPKVIFPNYVGRPKYNAILPTTTQQDYYLGNIKEESRGLLKLKYPMNHGIVQDWNDMDLIWRHTYKELNADPKQFPVLLTEPPLNPHNHKVQMAQQFFENYNVPALFVAVQGVLSLFASGKTTGILFDCGDGVTQVVPVYEGYQLQHANQRIDIGGRDITQNLVTLLRRSGYSFNTTAEFEIVKQIKEKKCFVSPSSQSEDKFFEGGKIKDSYTLPDGTPIEFSFEKTRAPEILFAPERAGMEIPSLPEILVNAIQKVDIDLRKTLYQEIVLAGGATMMQDFPDRFMNEVKKLIPKKDIKLRFYVTSERDQLCWKGGGILSSLNYFKSMWILKKEYEDEGERILLKKSF